MSIIRDIKELINLFERGFLRLGYTPRIKRQRKRRGLTKYKAKRYYRSHRNKIKIRQKRYRKRYKNFLHMRERKPHYKRVGHEQR